MLKKHTSDLKQMEDPKAQMVLASFFFSVEVHGETDYVHMLQSILFQILLQCPTLFPAYERVYDEGRLAGTRPWSLDVLQDCFNRMKNVRGQQHRIYIFIDAADECDLPEKVFEMAQSLSQEDPQSGLVFKIFLTSRPTDLTIPGQFLEISTQNDPDIDRLIDIGVVSIKEVLTKSSHAIEWKTEFSTKLEKMSHTLHNDANGVILWVALILRRVEKELSDGVLSPADLAKIAKTNPTDLNTLYTVIIDRLKLRHEYANQWKRIKKGLAWGAHAFELLTKQSFATATALAEVDTGAEEDDSSDEDDMLNEDNVNDDEDTTGKDDIRRYTFLPLDSPNFHKSLSALYGGFLELKSEGGLEVVGLLHRTVRAFLKTPEACPFQIVKEDCDGIIASACVQYLRIFVRKHSGRARARNAEYMDEACLHQLVTALDS